MDRLTALRLFLRIIEAGSISAAGRGLGLSTTAASKGLQDLEAALGLRLIARTTRHASPTEAGLRLHQRLTGPLGEIDTALREAAELPDQPSGLLRVVARRSFGLMHIAPALAGFHALHPRVDVDLTLTEVNEIAPVKGVDLVVRLGRPAEKSFAAQRLAADRRILCASPAYLAHHPAPTGADALGDHAILCYRREVEPTIWIFETAAGPRPMEVSGPLRSNSGAVLRQAALDGLGLALLPEWMVGADVAAGRLVACLAGLRIYPAGYEAEMFGVHARAEPVPAKISAFLTHLAERLSR